MTPVLAEPGPILIEKGQQTSIRRTVELPETLTAPVEKGEIIGTLTVCAGDTELARLPLTADADVGRLTFGALFLTLLRTMCGGE